MVKTVTAGMAAHLLQETTSLATCWRLTRTDKRELFFTDHDVDVLFENNTYKASTGYRRTAIQNDSSLAVDNLDVEGIFDSEEITEQDLRAGVYDHAQVRIFFVNWEDPTDGDVKMRNGRLGEVILTESGIFRAELRGLTQALSQRIGELYQPECRVDLGDARCKAPVQPDIRLNNTAYILGDFVRVPTAVGAISTNVRFLVPADVDADSVGQFPATATVGSEAAVQGTTVKFGTGALEFTPTAAHDPSNAFVSYPDNVAYSLGSDDFTIEGWVRFKSLSNPLQVLASQYLNTGDQRSWYLRRNSSNLQAFFSDDGTDVAPAFSFNGTFVWATGVWYHVAVTRSGDVWRLFVGGALLASTTASLTVHDSTEVLRLGKLRDSGGDDLPIDGFLDDWRITVGVAQYTAAFTPPDRAFDTATTISPEVRVLVQAEDGTADSGGLFPSAATLGTEARVQRNIVKFGVGALEFSPTATVDPSEAFVSYPDVGNYLLTSEDFTIEGHVRFKDLTAVIQQFASQYLNTGNQRSWYVRRNGSTMEAFFSSDGSSFTLITESFMWAPDTQYHFAVTRDGTDWRLFVDGTQLGSTTVMSLDVFKSTEVLRLGKVRSAGADDQPLDGFLDDFRLTIGTALYTANFTPPAQAFDAGASPTPQDVYENRIYECTTAGSSSGSQPAFDTTVDVVTDEAVAATGVLTMSANAADTETVTVDGKVYTFQTVLTDVDGNVLVGASASDSIDNLVVAVTLGAGAGTLYAASTVLHPTVTAAAGAGDTMDAVAKATGTAGNSIATAETGANMSWAGSTLAGGVDGVAWTAREAWTRHAWTGVVTDRREFTLSATGFSEPRAVDNWFNGGGLTFEGGDNVRRTSEAKDWAQAPRDVKLFLPTPYAILPGTPLRLYPGCDKRLTTCITKFAIPGSRDFALGNAKNFRGEPFVPGQDKYLRYPDGR